LIGDGKGGMIGSGLGGSTGDIGSFLTVPFVDGIV
jgi:hypothetical protein